MRDYFSHKIDRKAAQVGESIGYGLFNVCWWAGKKLFSPIAYLLTWISQTVRLTGRYTQRVKVQLDR